MNGSGLDFANATCIMYSVSPPEQDVVICIETSIAACEGDCNVCSQDSSVKERRQRDKEDRLSLVVWRRPVTTLHYFLQETLVKLKEWTFQ